MLKFLYHPCALLVVRLDSFIQFIRKHVSLYQQIQNLETRIETNAPEFMLLIHFQSFLYSAILCRYGPF
jgi:hypothetical protein